eukprot:s1758_g14.t1
MDGPTSRNCRVHGEGGFDKAMQALAQEFADQTDEAEKTLEEAMDFLTKKQSITTRFQSQKNKDAADAELNKLMIKLQEALVRLVPLKSARSQLKPKRQATAKEGAEHVDVSISQVKDQVKDHETAIVLLQSQMEWVFEILNQK